MKTALLVMAVAGLTTAGAAMAQSGAEVAKAKCMMCHDVDKKKAGPSFKDIAAKHKDTKDAGSTLLSKLKEGKGHPKVSASDAEISSAVQHVLSAK